MRPKRSPNRYKTNKVFKKSGSLTVEASIALPIFICVILSIILFIRILYVEQTMQHAITEAANEIGMYSYVYVGCGIDQASNRIGEKIADVFNNNIEEFMNGLKLFSNKSTDLMKGSINNEALDLFKTLGDKTISIDMLNVVSLPLIKMFVMKNLKEGDLDINKKLKYLGVVNGVEGLDFSDSRLLNDGDNVKIVVKYKLKIPLPINFLSNINIKQNVLVRAWLGGENPEESEEGSGADPNIDPNGSIWDLSDFQRGKIIQEKLGRNLPDKFPVIAQNNNGDIAKIRSIDLEDKTYKNPNQLKNEMISEINRLANFKGARYGKVEILEKDIKSRKIIFVFPEVLDNELLSEILRVIDDCRKYAKENKITMETIKAFGRKRGG